MNKTKSLKLLFVFLLSFSFITPHIAQAEMGAHLTANFRLAKHKDNSSTEKHGHMLFRPDFFYFLAPWFMAGGFIEMFKLDRNLANGGGEGDTRWSYGPLVGIQFGNFMTQLLFGLTDDKDSGITAQLEFAYVVPLIDNKLFIGPKLSLRTYKIGDVSQTFWEPAIHSTFWF